MKPGFLIFVYIFLIGMIFTVIQYTPILEEESPHAKVEFFKKSKSTPEGDGSEDGDPDADSNTTTEGIISNFSFQWANLLTYTSRYISKAEPYSCIQDGITTPPPRI